MNPTKLLLISSEFSPQPGGIGTHAFHLAQELQLQGIEVTVLTDIRSASGEEEKAFDATLPFSVARIRRKRILAISYLNRIRKAFQLSRGTEVVLLSGKFSLWTGALLKLFYKRRMIAVVHGSEALLPNPVWRSVTNYSLKQCDHVVAVSNYTRSLLVPLHLKNCSVIHNGISLPEQVQVPRETPVALRLITIGNLTRRKGQHNVIQALPALLKVYPGLQYDMVGIPTEIDALRKLSVGLEVEHAVRFHGRVSEVGKQTLLREAAIFVMLSERTERGDVEGFGIAILEANAMGLPAIGAVDCGIMEAIAPGKSGELIDPHAPEALVAAVTQIMKNYGEYSEHAIQWAQQFTWKLAIRPYLDILNNWQQ